MRRFFSLLAAAILLITAAGCAGKETPAEQSLSEAEKKGELRLPLLTLPYTFNPCVADEGDPAVVQNLFSRLFRITGTGELAGDLVSQWDYAEGSTDITMKLRSGSIRWHDGQALTSADIKFTLEGIKTQQGVLAEQLAAIESVEVTSDTQFVIHLTRYEPFILYTLAQDGASILPKHLYEGQVNWVTAPAATAPIGSGPYKFVERVEGTSITLERFPGYYGGSPKVGKLIFKLYQTADDALEGFEAGELDVLDCGMPMAKAAQYSASDDYQLVTTDDASRISLVFNVTSGIFVGNPDLRRAILYALDREDIAAAAAPLTSPSDSFIAPLFEAVQNKAAALPSADAARADELLDAKYDKDASGKYLRITMTVFEAEPYPEIAAVIKQKLADAGIELTVVQLPFDEWQEDVLTSGEFEMALSGGSWGPYPEAIIHRVATGGALNYGGYNFKSVSDKLYAAMFEGKPGLRASYLSDVQETLVEHLPLIPLVDWYSPVALQAHVENPPQRSETLSPFEYSETDFK